MSRQEIQNNESYLNHRTKLNAMTLELYTSASNLNAEITTLGEDVTALDTVVTNSNTDVQNLETQVTNLKTRADDLESFNIFNAPVYRFNQAIAASSIGLGFSVIANLNESNLPNGLYELTVSFGLNPSIAGDTFWNVTGDITSPAYSQYSFGTDDLAQVTWKIPVQVTGGTFDISLNCRRSSGTGQVLEVLMILERVIPTL